MFTPDEAKLVISFWVEATSRAQHKGASRLCSRASPRPLSLPPTTKNRRRLSLPVPHTGSRAMASARAMRAALQKIAERGAQARREVLCAAVPSLCRLTASSPGSVVAARAGGRCRHRCRCRVRVDGARL